jgi:hypothetical protein
VTAVICPWCPRPKSCNLFGIRLCAKISKARSTSPGQAEEEHS